MSQARKKPSRHCWAGEPFESMWYIGVWECMGFDFIFSPSDDRVPQTRVRGAFYCGEFEGESLPFSFGFCFFWCNEPTVTREPCLLEAARQAIESLSGAVQPTLTGSTQADTKRTQSGHCVNIKSVCLHRAYPNFTEHH